MYNIAVFGSNGMLGGMLVRTLAAHGLNVKNIPSTDFRVTPNSYKTVEYALNMVLHNKLPDMIVNCIGAIKPKFNNKSEHANNVYVNAIFPHQLASYCELRGIKFSHISTDCVFSGKDGGYLETSVHDATDDYGKSKSLGEPTNCMVLRTSIIGPEWNGNHRSLVEWLLRQCGTGKVNGFNNHLWNGLTTLELSECIVRMIKQNIYAQGTYHIFSNDVTKDQMLRTMIQAWELPIEVNVIDAPDYCNRTLRTVKGLNQLLSIKPFDQMVADLKGYILNR